MSISTNRRRGIRVGLRNGAWGSSGNWSSRSLEWKCFLHCRINSEGGSMKSLTTKNTAAWRNPCPQISNPGVHLKPENFWTSLITSSLEEVTRGKMPLLCFLLGTLEITLSSKPHWNGGPAAWPSYVFFSFPSSHSGLVLEGGTAGIPEAFWSNGPTYASSLCMHCSSQELALNSYLF